MRTSDLKFMPMVALMSMAVMTSCSDDDNTPGNEPSVTHDDYSYVGKAVGNFTAEEWYPGGELGTTDNIASNSYEDETPAVTNQGLSNLFKFGESFFERTFNSTTKPFNGLGPAWTRDACLTCHPGYGHGMEGAFQRSSDRQPDQRLRKCPLPDAEGGG